MLKHNLRGPLILILVAAAVLLAAGSALAQSADEWPRFPEPKDPNAWRGPGFYLNWLKIAACWWLFLLWVLTTDWLSRDAQDMKLAYRRWNPIVVGTFLVAFALFWVVPWFWLDLPILVIAYVAPLGVYIVHRNRRVGIDEQVLTRAHLRYWLSHRARKVGVKMAEEAPDPHETGPPVKLLARGGPSDCDNAARLLTARQSPGLTAAREIVAAGLACRAAAIMLDYAQEAVAVRYLVDGVWLVREPLRRQKADPALEALKLLCGLKPQDRQARQEGAFAAEFQDLRYNATLGTAGTKTGERAVVQFEEKKVPFETLEQLGMRPKVQEQLKELLDRERGLVLFSAIPAGGLRSTITVALRGTDRLMRDFVSVEDEGNRCEEVECVHVTTYKAAGGETPMTVLPKLLLAGPHVVLVRELANRETAGLLCREVAPQRLALGAIRAKDAPEALLRVLALKVPPAELAPAITAVLHQRLVRKLCEACKEAYTPAPDVLKQLGIPEGRVAAFYRPPEPPPGERRAKPCPKCGGVGYLGRTAIFELLVVGDLVRKALTSSALKIELLRSAARKDGMKTIQEEGVLLAAKGVTSLPELMRVLKL